MFISFICLAVLAGDILAQGKGVLMVIGHSGFRDEELSRPKVILEEAGYQVSVASSSLKEAKGILGARVKPQILLGDAKAADYEAVIFVGGIGAQEFWHDPVAHHLAQEAISQGKVLGAICIAPVILANAGILRGKKATVWASEEAKLKKKGGSVCREDGGGRWFDRHRHWPSGSRGLWERGPAALASMKLCIISDTHGGLMGWEKALKSPLSQVDLAILPVAFVDFFYFHVNSLK